MQAESVLAVATRSVITYLSLKNCGLAFKYTQNIFFTHNQHFFTVNFNLSACVLTK